MKSSYKVSLLIAAVLSIVVVWYYGSQSQPNEATADIQQLDDAEPAPSPLASDLRSRLSAAAGSPDKPTALKPATPAPSPDPIVPEMKLDGSAPASKSTPPRPDPFERLRTGSTSTPPPASAESTYTVQSGDSFTRIAVKVFGDESYWDDIAKANPTVDPGKLRVGQTLKLPGKAALAAAATHTDPAAAAPADTVIYIVKSGDTLSEIAKTYYNDTSRWQYLYNVNKAAIGTNPNTLKAGTKLKIPPHPKAAE